MNSLLTTLPATEVELIYSGVYTPTASNLKINNTLLTAVNTTSNIAYTGDDLDPAFVDAKTIKYNLASASETELFNVSVWSDIRVCGVIIDGVRLVDFAQKLTLASDKDLAQFSANDDVEQDSGYTPQTSAITNVNTKITPIYSNFLTSNFPWSGSYTPDKAFNGVMDGDGGCATDGTADCKYTHPEIITVTKLEMRSYSGLDLTLPDGSTTTCPGIGGQEIWSEVAIPNGSFTFDGTNFILMKWPTGTTYFDGIKLNGVELIDSQTSAVLILTDDKDLANFRVGDAISIPDNTPQTADVKFALTSPYQDNGDYYLRSGYTDNGGGEEAPLGTYTDIISVTDAGVLELNARAYGNIGPVTIELVNGTTDDPLIYAGASAEQICPSTVTFGAGGGSMKITWQKTENLSDHAIYYLYFSGQNNSTWQGGIIAGGKTYEVVSAVTGAVTAIGPGNTLTLNKAGFNIGETVTGPATTPATGTVASTDPAAKTMTLATSDESGSKRWIVDAGKTVVGPTGPATRFDAYLTWSGNQVTGLSPTDPGYFQAPPDLQLQFTDPAPSGQTWDQELPTGTTIQTRVKATNASGEANSGWSNVVTPRFLSASHVDESEHCYGATASGLPLLRTGQPSTKASKPWPNAKGWLRSFGQRG